jgi:hypothetical protein
MAILSQLRTSSHLVRLATSSADWQKNFACFLARYGYNGRNLIIREVSMHLIIVALLLFAPIITHAANVVDIEQLQLKAEPVDSSVPIADLGQEIRRGVEARARLEAQPLLDISEPLDGGLRHYMISVAFIEAETGKTLMEGQVAARTITPNKRVAETVRLAPRDYRWTGVLVLPSAGETLIKIGTRLADGKKRIYRFFF